MQRRSLPYACPDIPGTGGEIKQAFEDFQVEEIPTYEPCGEGDHVYLWVEKRDVSGFELTKRIGAHFGVKNADVGMAGLKDRHAVTRQWVSVPGHGVDDETAVGPVDELVTVLKASRHTNKLKTGHLQGNRFRIRIRNIVDLDASFEHAKRSAVFLTEHGIPNFFGEQRFGRDDETVLLGMGLLDGTRSTRNKKLKRLALSAVQSAIFNETLILRGERFGLYGCGSGDILAKVTDGGARRVGTDDVEAATARFQQRLVVPTGPLPGPKMTIPELDVGEVEAAAIEACGVDVSKFAGFKKLARGSRRPIVCYSDEGIEVKRDQDWLEIAFCLPAGSYATVALHNIMKVKEGVSE